MPPLRHTYLPHETLDLADSMAFDGHLRQAQADVAFHAALPDALGSIWQAAPRPRDEDPFAPLPMPEAAPVVVSERPDAMRVREQLAQGTPAPLQASGSAGSGITFGPAAAQTADVTLPDGSQAAPDVAQRPVAAGTASPGAPSTSSGPPGDLRAWARSEAARLGIDPDVAEAVAMSEGGFDDPTRQSDVVYQGQRETSYGPFQLNTAGGLGSAAIAQGIDPRNPAHARAGVTFALEHAAREGWGAFHGAARVGIGPRQGIGVRPAAGAPAAAPRPSPASAPPHGVPTAVADGPDWKTRWGNDLTPDQIQETLALGMSWDAALATCGVAASVAFARANGRNPTFGEALELAKRTGEWNPDVGMARGSTGQVALLKGLGVDARVVPLNEQTIVSEIGAGRPVQINAQGNGGHYYVASGYNPETRQFYFGNSASILKRSGGRQWFRLDELAGLGVGTPAQAILLGAGG
jgi:hypothetical protein